MTNCDIALTMILMICIIGPLCILLLVKYNTKEKIGYSNTPPLKSCNNQLHFGIPRENMLPAQNHTIEAHEEKRSGERSGEGRVIGSILANERLFMLRMYPHPYRRWRYLYNAQSSDLSDQMTLHVHINGNDVTDPHGLGSAEIMSGETVYIPELSIFGTVFIRPNHSI